MALQVKEDKEEDGLWIEVEKMYHLLDILSKWPSCRTLDRWK